MKLLGLCKFVHKLFRMLPILLIIFLVAELLNLVINRLFYEVVLVWI